MRIGLVILAAVALSVTVGCHKGIGITTPTSLAVTSVNPTFAPAGSSIDLRILGMGFRAGATVSVDADAANVVVVSDTIITATVPAHRAGPADVVVTNPNGESTTLSGGLTFVASGLTPKAVVNGTFEVSQLGTEPDQISYVFALKLNEAGGVPATVTRVWITFDDRWGAECTFAAEKLGQKRVPANGTSTLDPLTCDDGHGQAISVDVEVDLTDDNGHQVQVYLYREIH